MANAHSAAQRRYTWRVGAAMIGYVATLFLAEYLIGEGQVTGPLAYAVALLPGLCVASVFWALALLLIDETDEYRRMLLARQLLIASGITMTVATIYGFLENFQLVPHIDAFWLAMLFFFSQGIGSLVNRVTLGDSGGC
jgi:hypothetical protein